MGKPLIIGLLIPLLVGMLAGCGTPLDTDGAATSGTSPQSKQSLHTRMSTKNPPPSKSND